MSLYLDASVLVALFVEEKRTDEAVDLVTDQVLVVSDFAMAEFSSAIGRRVRLGDISKAEAESVYATFDAWIAATAQREDLVAGDVLAALHLVRRLDLALRTRDAINIVIARRCGSAILTFDTKMAAAIRTLDIEVATKEPGA